MDSLCPSPGDGLVEGTTTSSTCQRPARSCSLDIIPSSRRGSRGPGNDCSVDVGSSGGCAGCIASQSRVQSAAYKTGDLVEYFSQSQLAWIPATVVFADFSGCVIVNVNPGCWLSPEDQRNRLRVSDSAAAPSTSRSIRHGSWNGCVSSDLPQKSATPNPPRRPCIPTLPRSQSLRDVGSSWSPPMQAQHSHRPVAMTPPPARSRSLSACAPDRSQRNCFANDESPPLGGSVLSVQVKQRRPPAIPRADSLRRGGAAIAGL